MRENTTVAEWISSGPRMVTTNHSISFTARPETVKAAITSTLWNANLLQGKGEILGIKKEKMRACHCQRIGEGGYAIITNVSEMDKVQPGRWYCLRHDPIPIGNTVMKRCKRGLVTNAAAALVTRRSLPRELGHSSGRRHATPTRNSMMPRK